MDALGTSENINALDADGTGNLYGTVRPIVGASVSLARIDPLMGKATVIGGTDKTDVFALTFQGSVLYGLAGSGQVLTLNTSTEPRRCCARPV
ncbi:hypothetical protein GCM10008949_51570 [Deinococcus humi]|nr:hypothetical protein GCM10008949_51570 [Deinococcus humi]